MIANNFFVKKVSYWHFLSIKSYSTINDGLVPKTSNFANKFRIASKNGKNNYHHLYNYL